MNVASPTATQRRPLAARRAPVAATVVAAFAVLAALGWWVHGNPRPVGFDEPTRHWLVTHTDSVVARLLLALTDPVLTVGILVLISIGALVVRAFDVVAIAGLAPLVGLLLESHVLKPAFDRRFGLAEQLDPAVLEAGYAYPSGHETGLAATTTVVALLVLRLELRRGPRRAAVAGLVTWTLLGAVGLVGNNFHYATDTVGGICLGTGLVLATALLADAVAARRAARPPAGQFT
ncbi:undecaprenyl-diphosphatase [Jatrophihabitans endophyticus]|uniref:Undecaprenyl-diphosphatase n=1 Tax=Jatrophihabitans endophyticus TaxID=1206085 RepID=A0A1M5U1J7_9ACTN|nr:phosphatase PAP2 family protein [Jatrophihabitans endophyticus]SHH56902.1 undecaprenyl-diphosphatase [Jatrophihabitans endophyticus]